jgi:hypothetical protein
MFVGTGTLRKPQEYARARDLRTRGEPLKRIARKVGVSVSTVHAWTRDIELTPEQQRHNLRGPGGPKNPEDVARRAATWRHVNRERRRGFQEQGRRRASDGSRLHLAGCMLYWSEGAKDRNNVKLANSDVAMVRFFCRFLMEAMQISADDITISVNAYTGNGLTMREIEDWWLDALDLPRESLRKGIENHRPTSSSGKKKNKLPHGVCSLRVKRSTWLVQHIYGAIQEYAGFEEPRWLDCDPASAEAPKSA